MRKGVATRMKVDIRLSLSFQYQKCLPLLPEIKKSVIISRSLNNSIEHYFYDTENDHGKNNVPTYTPFRSEVFAIYK